MRDANLHARAYTARATQQLLQNLNWQVLDDLAHTPDLLPSGFHLLLRLKNCLSSQNFQEDEAMKNVVTTWLCLQTAELCYFRIRKLIPRLKKCLDKGGDYVKK